MANALLKQAIAALKQESRDRTPFVNRWFKWLIPGLFVKRWLLLSSAGVICLAIGIAIWSNQTPVFHLLEFVATFLRQVTHLMPSYVSGPLVIVAGFLLIFWGQSRSLSSITEVLVPGGDRELVDRLVAHRRLHRGAKIVALGGGTGLSSLLRGLKSYSANITAIVTVADDGGSSGRLRREMGILPPGDIRNCIAALADEEKLLTELFQYRFQAGDGLVGHSFGNLFLTAMSEVTGDLERAIAASSDVLAIRGAVLPATLNDMRLWAELEDGRFIEGESNITHAKGNIARIGCTPENPIALPKALQAIAEADLIIIGPGSLYTSVIPNLLVPEIAEAIAARKDALRVYVCNIMTQPGETTGYSVADHIRAIDRATGMRLFNAVLVQKNPPSESTRVRYAQEDSTPVVFDREEVFATGRRPIVANIMDEDNVTGYVRHDSTQLAKVLLHWYARVR
jgi:uncharacterized cofD-like protein